MRKDMKHVIIDRPRTGGDGGKSIPRKGSKKRLQKTPLEEQPKYESNARKRLYGYDCKQLNEHLRPLRRWLDKQVGRDWDDVWSEICEGLSVRNATSAHVRDHADQYVEKDCVVKENGSVVDSEGFTVKSYGNYQKWFVDPRDNSLQSAPRSKPFVYERKQDWIAGKNENHRYYLLKGVWYEVELRPTLSNRVYDLVLAAKWKNKKPYIDSPLYDCQLYYKRSVYAFKKRQLGKREIKKLDLWNSNIV